MTSSDRRWRLFRSRRLSKRDVVSYTNTNANMSEAKRIAEGSESGQAMTEYVILLFGCMLTLLGVLMPMANAIHTYMKSIYFCVSLPYP
jgi:hypothetical protein